MNNIKNDQTESISKNYVSFNTINLLEDSTCKFPLKSHSFLAFKNEITSKNFDQIYNNNMLNTGNSSLSNEIDSDKFYNCNRNEDMKPLSPRFLEYESFNNT